MTRLDSRTESERQKHYPVLEGGILGTAKAIFGWSRKTICHECRTAHPCKKYLELTPS